MESSVLRKDILAAAERSKDKLVRLVSDLIRIPNENPTGSQRGAIDFLKNYLLQSDIVPVEVASNPDFPCILAQIGSAEGYSVILNGHIDVVPAGERTQWRYDPFSGEVTETQILGRGTSDMKAGLAGLVFAMKILKETGAGLHGNIRLHVVSDEESGGQYGTRWLCSEGYAAGAQACIIGEPTSKNTIEIGQKGGLHLIFKASGQAAHGSLGGFKGDNAILKLQKVLENVHLLTAIEGHYPDNLLHALQNSKRVAEMELQTSGIGEVINHVSANVGMIKGGTRPNMVPDYCEAIVDCRLPVGVDHAEIEATVSRIIKMSGQTGVSCDFLWKTEANYTMEDSPIVQAVKRNAEKLWNIEVIPAYQWASSDAREYRELGIQTIQYGPSNTEGIHAPNENVDIEDVVNAAMIYIMTLCDLMGIK
jgi:succinyl-diaminopimelate desuccinylase